MTRRNGPHALALSSLPASPTTHPVAAALARMAPTTRRTMLAALQGAAQLLSGRRCDAWSLPWADLRYENVLALRQAQVDLHLAPSTINRTLACLRAVITDAWRLGLIPADVLLRVKDVPPVRSRRLPRGRMLSTDELARLQRSCRRDGILGARDLALVALCYGTALRRAEVAALSYSDLRPDGVHVIGKGNLEVIQPLPAGARRLLAPWLRIRGTAPGPLVLPVGRFGIVRRRRLFPTTVYQALKRRARAAGVAAFGPHDLRRSFVSHLLDRGVELRVVQTLARHAQVTTTQRYDRRALGALKTAADRLPL